MSKHRKYTPEEKIRIVKEYLSGESSLGAISQRYGYSRCPGSFWTWAAMYREYGEEAFHKPKGNNSYSKEFKTMLVEEYLRGTDSATGLSVKYRLGNASVLLWWVKLYNANRELKDYDPKREVYMADTRKKTTLEQRKEIVRYCLSHNRDYKGTASIYDVSYSQVYSWVRKYDDSGEDGLTDRRGKHKRDDEVDETERLRRENVRLKRQLEEKDRLVELLKKVKEFKRR